MVDDPKLELGHWCLLMRVTADRSSRKNPELYGAVLSAEIQPNSAKPITQPKTCLFKTSFSRQRKEVAEPDTRPQSKRVCSSLTEDKEIRRLQ